MSEELAVLLKRAMALPANDREILITALLSSLGEVPNGRDDAWTAGHRKKALAGLEKSGRVGFMEASFRVAGGIPETSQPDLVRSAERAAIHAFGWPIGIVLHNENRPRPMSEGIVAEVSGIDASYDYWALRKNGDFFFLGSLFEDERAKEVIWFDTRVMRVTETLLFCYRLYKSLGATDDSVVKIKIGHGGLRGRSLGSARPALWGPSRISHENEVAWNKEIDLATLRARLQEIVKEALAPLLILFDYYQPQDGQVYSITDEFLTRVSNQQTPFEL